MTWIAALIIAGLWTWPVSPVRVEQGFDPPEQAWSRGHRGIDLAAHPGSLIRSIGDGQVAFVGTVAGTPVIAIEHPRTGLRSTYQPVAPLVQRGDPVSAGAPIGYLAGPLATQGGGERAGAQDSPGGHCAGRCLHLGLRGTDGYVDPLTVLPRTPAILKPVVAPFAGPGIGPEAAPFAGPGLRPVAAPIADALERTCSAASQPTHACSAESCPRRRAPAAPGLPAGQPLPREHGWQRYAGAHGEQAAGRQHHG